MNFEGKTGEFISPQQVLGNIDGGLLGDGDESVNVLLINEVKKYPILYDFNNEKYSDKEIRARIWSRISEDLGISTKEAKHQWKRLRDSLRDALKRQEGKMGVSCRKTWRYHKKMEFVIPFMTNREATGNTGNSKRSRSRRNAHSHAHPHQDAALSMLASGSSSALMPKALVVQGSQTTSGLSYTGLSTPVSFNFVAANGSRSSVSYGTVSTTINAQNTVQTSCSMQQRSLNVTADGASYYNSSTSTSAASSSRLYKAEGTEMSLLEELAHKPLDEDLYFCLSMAASMKRLSEQRRARLKCDMMSMLYTAQCEEAFP